MPSASSPTASTAGITASQNASRKSSDDASMISTASSGPVKAPIVSSACLSPNAAPRSGAGVTSATSASRGAPRIPLPIRSISRAPTTTPMPGASANSGFDSAPSA